MRTALGCLSWYRRRALGLAITLGLWFPACGGTTDNHDGLGGESHFLRKCSGSCGGGLDCISGLCTRGCLVGEATCGNLSAAAMCTSASIEPGAVAVCDVACSGDAACASLGAEHRCEGGFCRAPASAPAPMQTSEGGAGGSTGGELPASCPAFRNQPGDTAVAITIRNERDTHIYLQPFRGECENTPATLVDFERGSEVVNVRGFAPGFCEALVCEDIQDNGFQEPLPCIASCPQAPSLVRLEPGAELQVGGAWNEYLSHGILLPSERMPNACYGGESNESFPSSVECYSQRPLPPGEYRIVARAFLEVECPNDLPPCDCVPDGTGSCSTGAAFGRGEAPLTSFATAQVPAANVTLTFQDD